MSPTNSHSWHSAVSTLARLASIPIEALDLPASFAPNPVAKPYFPRQVRGLMKVSEAQAQAPVPANPGGILGDIVHTDELRPWFEQGAQRVTAAGAGHGQSIVHGDYKLDNLVSAECGLLGLGSGGGVRKVECGE